MCQSVPETTTLVGWPPLHSLVGGVRATDGIGLIVDQIFCRSLASVGIIVQLPPWLLERCCILARHYADARYTVLGRVVRVNADPLLRTGEELTGVFIPPWHNCWLGGFTPRRCRVDRKS